MSLETTLERIANNLGRIADTMDKFLALDTAAPEPETPAKPPKKGKQDKKPKLEAVSSAPPEDMGTLETPQDAAQLIAMVTEGTKGLAPEKMIELSRMLREDFKVAKLPDLPEDDYANFTEQFKALVNG